MPKDPANTGRVSARTVEKLHERLLLLNRLRDPERVGALATEVIDLLRALEDDVSAMRDTAVRALHDQGGSMNDIARRIGVTRGRVFQIIQRGRVGEANR